MEKSIKSRLLQTARVENLCPIAILSLGLFIRLGLAWFNLETLLQKLLPDDAFYYFVVARHIAQGRGPTIDGHTLTNGFHPLWALTLAPVYAALPGGNDLPVHLSLTLGAIFDSLAAWLGYVTVRTATRSEKAALVTLGLYVFNPKVIVEAINGLETALNIFLLALCFWWYFSRSKKMTVRDGAILGFLAGLMVLARTDTIFLFVFMLLAVLLRRRLEGLGPVLVSGVVFSLALAPWLVWNQLTFGTTIQSSGIAVPYLIQRYFPVLVHDREVFLVLWRIVFSPVILLSFQLAWRYCGVAWIIAIASPIILRWVRARHGEVKAAVTLPAAFWLPTAAALALLAFHTFYRWFPRNWYYIPLAWAASLVAGPVLVRTGQALRRASLFYGLLLGGAALLFVLQGAKEWREGAYPWQLYMYRGAEWLNENTRPEEVVGAFNAGIYAYYSGRTVVNLDGVVNWKAFAAIREQRLFSYIDERNVAYIIESDHYVDQIYGPYFGEGYPQRLTPLETLSSYFPDFGTLMVYRVER